MSSLPPSKEEDAETTDLLMSICRKKGFRAPSACEAEIFSRDSCGTPLEVSFSEAAYPKQFETDNYRFPASIVLPSCDKVDRLYFHSYIDRGGHGAVAKYVGEIGKSGNYSTEFAVKVRTDRDESIVMEKLCKDAKQCGMVNVRKLIDTEKRSKFRAVQTRRKKDPDPIYHIMPVMDTLTSLFATMRKSPMYKVVVARICRMVLSQVLCILKHTSRPYLDLKASNILYTCNPDGDLRVKLGATGSLTYTRQIVDAAYPPPESGRSGAVRFDTNTSGDMLSWAMGTLFLQSMGPGACDGLEAEDDEDESEDDDDDDDGSSEDDGDSDDTATDESDEDGPSEDESDSDDTGTDESNENDESDTDDDESEGDSEHTAFTGNLDSKDMGYVESHWKKLTEFYGPLIGNLLHPDPAERTKLRDLEEFLSSRREPERFNDRTKAPSGRRRAVGRRRPLRKEEGRTGSGPRKRSVKKKSCKSTPLEVGKRGGTFYWTGTGKKRYCSSKKCSADGTKLQRGKRGGMFYETEASGRRVYCPAART